MGHSNGVHFHAGGAAFSVQADDRPASQNTPTGPALCANAAPLVQGGLQRAPTRGNIRVVRNIAPHLGFSFPYGADELMMTIKSETAPVL